METEMPNEQQTSGGLENKTKRGLLWSDRQRGNVSRSFRVTHGGTSVGLYGPVPVWVDPGLPRRRNWPLTKKSSKSVAPIGPRKRRDEKAVRRIKNWMETHQWVASWSGFFAAGCLLIMALGGKL